MLRMISWTVFSLGVFMVVSSIAFHIYDYFRNKKEMTRRMKKMQIADAWNKLGPEAFGALNTDEMERELQSVIEFQRSLMDKEE